MDNSDNIDGLQNRLRVQNSSTLITSDSLLPDQPQDELLFTGSHNEILLKEVDDMDTVELGEGDILLDKIQDQARQKTLLFVKMKDGVSRINLLSYFIVIYLTNLILNIKISCITYLLVADYDTSQHDSGEIAGQLAFYGGLCIIPSEFIFGSLMEKYGRKKFVVCGFFVCGAMLIMMTRYSVVFPTLAIFYCVFSSGLVPALIAPFLVDYVKPESLGLANSISSVVALAGSISATTGVIKLQVNKSIDFIFDSVGILVLVLTFLLMFGLKDVFRTKVEKENFLFKDAFKEFLLRIKEEKSICLSFLANASSTMTVVANLQYGILALNEQYSTEKSAQDYISKQLSTMLLVGQLTFLPILVLMAFYLDKVRIWPVMLTLAFLQIICLSLFYISSSRLVGANLQAGETGSWIENICFTLIYILNQSSFPLNSTMLSKALKKSKISRAITGAAFFVCSSVSALIMDSLGGSLYQKSPPLPFLMCLGPQSLLVLSIVVFALLGDLHI